MFVFSQLPYFQSAIRAEPFKSSRIHYFLKEQPNWTISYGDLASENPFPMLPSFRNGHVDELFARQVCLPMNYWSLSETTRNKPYGNHFYVGPNMFRKTPATQCACVPKWLRMFTLVSSILKCHVFQNMIWNQDTPDLQQAIQLQRTCLSKSAEPSWRRAC